MDSDLIEDGLWDFYSGMPNPKWYDESNTFSDSLEEDER